MEPMCPVCSSRYERRNYGPRLKVIDYRRYGGAARAVLERPDGTRFRRWRAPGWDRDIEGDGDES